MAPIYSFAKAIPCFLLAVFLTIHTTHAQDNFDEFIEMGSADATVIYEAYANPMLSGLNWAFNRGWYHTAKAHKPLGFDFSINTAFAFVPESGEFYRAGDIASAWNANDAAKPVTDPSKGFPTRWSQQSPASTAYPTVVGPTAPAPFVEIYNPETGQYEEIEGPVGFDFINEFAWVAVPVVMPQFGIGLIKNTDLKFRFLPKVGSDDVKLKMFGVGLMHDLKQWIPGNSVIPIDISFMVAYSDIDFEVRNIDDDDVGDDAFLSVSNWTYQLLISKTFHIVTFYGGFGYNSANLNIDILGEYDIIASPVPIVDPIQSETKDDGFNASFGVRFKLAAVTFNAEYSFQEFNTFSAGIGLSIR